MVKVTRHWNLSMILKRFLFSFIPGIIIYELFLEYRTLTVHEKSATEMAMPGGTIVNVSLVEFEPGVNTKQIPNTEVKERKKKEHLEQHMIFGADIIHNIKRGDIEFDDPHLLGYIRRHIYGPSELPLNISDPYRNDFSQIEQSVFVDFALGYRRNGFYVDCGAGDGELFSNTLFFERDREWKGLLIEPNPGDFNTLLHKRRKVFSINACVSPKNRSSIEILRSASGFVSGLQGYVDELHKGTDFKNNWWYQGDIAVQCFPFYSIMLALDIDHIDYLSIDVEGPEAEILQTIPYDKIRVDIITVEYRAKGQQSDLIARSMEKLALIRSVIGKTGLYDEVGILPPLKIFNRNQAMQSQTALEKTGLDVVFRRTDLRDES